MIISKGYIKHPQIQQGAALIVALVFLIILSLLAVSSMDSTVLETKLAANYREKFWAFQAAETGLMEGQALSLEQTNKVMSDLELEMGDITNISRDDISTNSRTVNAKAENILVRYKGAFGTTCGSATVDGVSGIKSKIVANYFITTVEGFSSDRANSRKAYLRQGICRFGAGK